jgi:head-tail adaptor
MAAMIVGNMRKRITIKRLTQTKDAYGATKDSYSDVMTLNAALKNQRGNLTLQNFEIFNTSVITFIIYFRNILTTDRIEYESNLYKIMDLTEIGYKEALEVTCELINV